MVTEVPDLGGPEVRALYERARSLVLAAAPEAVEKHYPRNKTVTFDLRKSDDFVYVNVGPKGINLGFFFGVLLPDPAALLEGSGRRMRHVKVRRLDRLDSEQVAELIVAARDRVLGRL